MTHRPWRFLILAACVAIAALSLARRTPMRAQPPPPGKSVSKPRLLLGAASCSASVCHGGADLGQPLSEATTWRSLDPHARAYDSLLTPTSRAIAERVWGGKPAAHEKSLCLKCHVHPAFDHARPNFRKADGVGCESCHGAAQDWLTPHYRGDWAKADRPALGFADTRSLPGRAVICAKCHVGTPDANVDHDLIAAGHPPLRFEFATYLANLPPHWDVAKDKRANSTAPDKSIDFEWRAWSIGQSISSASALDLRAHRADPATGTAWPEFAEFDCFACHHDLRGISPRQDRKQLVLRRPGSLPLGVWYTVMLQPRPIAHVDWKARDALAKHARDEAAKIRAAAIKPLGADELRRLSMTPPRSWDEGAQRYLALLALKGTKHDAKHLKDAELDRLINKLGSDLK